MRVGLFRRQHAGATSSEHGISMALPEQPRVNREPTASLSFAPSALLTHLLLALSSDPIDEVWV